MNDQTVTDKANQLVNSMYRLITDGGDINQVSSDYMKARKCAIIMVQNILDLDVCWIDVQLQKERPHMYSIESTDVFWDEVFNELHCKCQNPIIRGVDPDLYCLTCNKPIN